MEVCISPPHIFYLAFYYPFSDTHTIKFRQNSNDDLGICEDFYSRYPRVKCFQSTTIIVLTEANQPVSIVGEGNGGRPGNEERGRQEINNEFNCHFPQTDRQQKRCLQECNRILAPTGAGEDKKKCFKNLHFSHYFMFLGFNLRSSF